MRPVLPLLLLVACEAPAELPVLVPYPNPFGAGDPQWAPQPHRENPREVVIEPGGEVAWISLEGSPDDPGEAVVRLELDSGDRTRVPVGPSPSGIALSPDGRFLVVFSRYASWATVIDTARAEPVGRIPCDPYATEGVFTPDGAELWVSNRWHDAVEVWSIAEEDGSLVRSGDVVRLPVADNPRDVAISADGRSVAVASLTGLAVSIFDVPTRTERVRYDLRAPGNGLAFAGDFLVVATTSGSTHHLPTSGPDGDLDGHPGDGTPNVNFQDLGNELAVLRVADGVRVGRYVEDTICCRDYRDVNPDDLPRRGDLLPPRSTWIVGGSLPEQVAVDETGERVAVTYSASNQWQAFRVDPGTGALTPEAVHGTGHNPHGIAFAGERIVVADRLGETVGVYDGASGTRLAVHEVGDLSSGPFPATDAEIGALVNSVTAPLTIDGDQSCTHCHRENGNIDKAFNMPLLRYPGRSSRMTMAYRGAVDTRPWFFEAGMDATNFKPVLNEFSRIENFCCSDYTLFPDGIPSDCATNPPPICFEAGNPGSADGFGVLRGTPFDPPRPTAYVTRDAFTTAAIASLIGRTESFGDGLYLEDPITGTRSPIPLGFDGVTKALGLFLLQTPRLLPNPNDADSPAARRGRALFERADVGCAVCHPAPSFALSTDVNPNGLPLHLGAVVSPVRDEDGNNLDLLSTGFIEAFAQTQMDTCEEVCGADACAADPFVCDDLREVRFGVPSLRGIWDRATGMLHHGEARGLREVLCTPGHPALQPGEIGRNERDGIPDTHGGTSHLTAREIDDLIAYMESL